jgi:hypothetical protein
LNARESAGAVQMLTDLGRALERRGGPLGNPLLGRGGQPRRSGCRRRVLLAGDDRDRDDGGDCDQDTRFPSTGPRQIEVGQLSGDFVGLPAGQVFVLSCGRRRQGSRRRRRTPAAVGPQVATVPGGHRFFRLVLWWLPRRCLDLWRFAAATVAQASFQYEIEFPVAVTRGALSAQTQTHRTRVEKAVPPAKRAVRLRLSSGSSLGRERKYPAC